MHLQNRFFSWFCALVDMIFFVLYWHSDFSRRYIEIGVLRAGFRPPSSRAGESPLMAPRSRSPTIVGCAFHHLFASLTKSPLMFEPCCKIHIHAAHFVFICIPLIFEGIIIAQFCHFVNLSWRVKVKENPCPSFLRLSQTDPIQPRFWSSQQWEGSRWGFSKKFRFCTVILRYKLTPSCEFILFAYVHAVTNYLSTSIFPTPLTKASNLIRVYSVGWTLTIQPKNWSQSTSHLGGRYPCLWRRFSYFDICSGNLHRDCQRNRHAADSPLR